MNENAELQAKIAAIAGKINQHKQQQPPLTQAPQHNYSHPYPPQPNRGYSRWAPYSRGGRAGYAPMHKNRTLVLNGTATPPSPAPAVQGTPAVATEPQAFVSSRGTNNQLMTKNTFEREQKHKLGQAEQQRVAKRQKRNVQEQARILRHIGSTTNQSSRDMVINGIRFQLTTDGSKLIRVPDATDKYKETPKKTRVVGVEFYRTKNGNLVRASALKAAARPTQIKPQCEHFTKHGTCPYGPRCHYAHDPNKVAICKDFLKAGTCCRGDNCDLSHEMTYHRVPACQYFLRGNCTNDACRYPHVFVSPGAPVCRAFATLGFCAKGADCDKRHVHECPDYANSGFCANRENGKCTLPHHDRASVLRKAAERQAKVSSDAESDLSSENEENQDDDIDDVDSDAEDIIMTGLGDDSHELSQQQDFVGFT